MPTPMQTPYDQRAMIVFVDRTECRSLRSLKRGFRHCFVALKHHRGWLVCDSLKNRIELALLELPESFDLAECYAEQGHHVLVGRTSPVLPRSTLSLTPLTCVSIAKRVLAVRAPWVCTPWQLFRHLLKTQPHIWYELPS